MLNIYQANCKHVIKCFLSLILLVSVISVSAQKEYDQPFKSYNDYEFLYQAKDFNGDGYGDFVLGIDDSDPEEVGDPALASIYFGTATGPVFIKTLSLPLFWAASGIAIGDFNGDGLSDLAIGQRDDPNNQFGSGRVQIYFGKSNANFDAPDMEIIGPENEASYGEVLRNAGDINKDGYEDLIAGNLYEWNKIFYGGPNGPDPNQDNVIADVRSWGAGFDFNHEGYSDLVGLESDGYFVYLGSDAGPVRSIQIPGFPSQLKDVNGDMMDDYGYYNSESKTLEIYYSSGNTYRKSDTVLNSIRWVNSAGDINGDGYADLLVHPSGSNQLLIHMGSKAGIVLEPKYKLPVQENYVLGNYGSAGDINKDGLGDIFTKYNTLDIFLGRKDTEVVVCNSPFNAVIPKAYQVNATQSAANTIYLGYANNTIRLVAWESRSKGPYRYKWSNGDTTRFTRVRHNNAGNYNYWVVISNESGCSDTAYTTIKVIDNYCPNPLKDFISQYFPQYLNDPFIISLLMASSQSYICSNGTTQCVLTSSIKDYINAGAKLGRCSNTGNAANLKSTEELEITNVLTISASPNPSAHEFNLRINGTKGQPYSLRIYNSSGALMMQKHNLTQELIRTGSSLSKGIYVAEVIQGNQRKSIRLLKIK